MDMDMDRWIWTRVCTCKCTWTWTCTWHPQVRDLLMRTAAVPLDDGALDELMLPISRTAGKWQAAPGQGVEGQGGQVSFFEFVRLSAALSLSSREATS